MLNSVAFIGYGFVGKACHKVFEHNTEAIIIDPLYSNNRIEDLRLSRPRLIFVSINAPTLDDRSVDASVIYDIFQQLADIKYDGLVVLKSTLPPDIVHDLYVKFSSDSVLKKTGPLHYIYSPEFLREATWEKDALSPAFMILAGDFLDCSELKDLYKKHSCIPSYCRFVFVDFKEAALAKYTINVWLATKVAFMNQIYQLYNDTYNKGPIHPDSWKAFTEILTADLRFGNSHVDVPGTDGQFGYGGTCFPKDIKAMIGYDKNERLSILREVELANTKIRLTGDSKPE